MLKACEAASMSVVPMARGSPSPAPQHANKMLSVSICRINWDRRAPSAARTAISFRRAPARANSKLDKFAQAINKTQATAQERMMKGR